MLNSLWRGIQASRERQAQTAAYVAAIVAEPAAADVAWLAEHGTSGDVDHARWELRYARRALGMVTAQRDALDDRTASDVAHALERAMATDKVIAPDKRRIAARQMNARLRAYSDAVQLREAPGTGHHLGRALLEFAGLREPMSESAIAHAGDLASRYLEETNAALRASFGTAALPEDVAPSEIVPRR